MRCSRRNVTDSNKSFIDLINRGQVLYMTVQKIPCFFSRLNLWLKPSVSVPATSGLREVMWFYTLQRHSAISSLTFYLLQADTITTTNQIYNNLSKRMLYTIIQGKAGIDLSYIYVWRMIYYNNNQSNIEQLIKTNAK